MTTQKSIIIASIIVGLSIITGLMLTHQRYVITSCRPTISPARCYNLYDTLKGEAYVVRNTGEEHTSVCKGSWGTFTCTFLDNP